MSASRFQIRPLGCRGLSYGSLEVSLKAKTLQVSPHAGSHWRAFFEGPNQMTRHEALGMTRTKNQYMKIVPHMSVERMVAFFLDGTPLLESENAHLSQCLPCKRAMIQAASSELQERYSRSA
jgi:hypothetical protein